MIPTPELSARCADLQALMATFGPVAVAFSGGVDSALVAKLALEVARQHPHPHLPSPVAVMAVSPSLAQGELQSARRLASEMEISLVTIETQETELPAYRQNAPDRCYYCKSTLYAAIDRLRPEYRFQTILNGTNADDLSDHRPGLVAAREYRVRSPLAECGLTKSEVREMARHFNLPVWDKPATPCLSSRIVYGLEVTPQRLSRVDQAEAFLKRLTGLSVLRVRHLPDDAARIEVPLDALPRLQSPAFWGQIQQQLTSIGFHSIELDPRGFRSGSLNESI